MIDVLIERSRWSTFEATGRNGGLLNLISGKMCCMGFMCLAAGCTEEEIRSHNSPLSLANCPKEFLVTDISVRLMRLNDCNLCIPQSEREALIAGEAKEAGFRVTFIGELT